MQGFLPLTAVHPYSRQSPWRLKLRPNGIHIMDSTHTFNILKEGMQRQIETGLDDLKFSNLSLLSEFVQMKLLSFWLLIIFVPVNILIKYWGLYFVLCINLIYSIVSIYQLQKEKKSYLFIWIFVHILTIWIICFTI